MKTNKFGLLVLQNISSSFFRLGYRLINSGIFSLLEFRSIENISSGLLIRVMFHYRFYLPCWLFMWSIKEKETANRMF